MSKYDVEVNAAPSLFERLKGLSAEAKKWLQAGAPLVATSTHDLRIAACLECPKLNPRPLTCSECGCLMAVKTWPATASCPLDPPRWKAILVSDSAPYFFAAPEREQAMQKELESWIASLA